MSQEFGENNLMAFNNATTDLILSTINTDKLLSKLPQKYRSGQVLVDAGDLLLYLNIFLLSFSGFCLLFLVLNLIFKRYNYFFGRGEDDKSDDDKFWRVQGWVLITHHILAVTLSVYSIRQSCLDEDNDETVHWQWLRSNECFATVSRLQVMVVMMSLGFLSFDFVLMKACL